jgi:hypothetical protein
MPRATERPRPVPPGVALGREEGLEDLIEEGRVYARALVLALQHEAAASRLVASPERHRRIEAGQGLQRVLEDADRHLRELLRIGPDYGQPGRRVEDEMPGRPADEGARRRDA